MRGGADIETGALVLIGDEGALRGFARRLRGPTRGILTLDPVAKRPALRPVTAVRFEAGNHPVTICVSDETATITGSPASYADLADDIELFLEHNDLAEPGAHMHIDGSHFLVEPGMSARVSADLIVAGPVPDV